MNTFETIARCLPKEAGECLLSSLGELREFRLRVNRPAQLVLDGQTRFAGEPVGVDDLKRILAVLTDFSYYAREPELRQGFFTLRDGCRVGVCGHVNCDGDRVVSLGSIGSISLRVVREMKGCADGVVPRLLEDGRVHSALIVSPPGMGKTTLLRDIARQVSERGVCVSIVDERHELAACLDGAPTMDVGPCTDVLDGMPKAAAIRRLVRTMSPEVIIADEVGGKDDAAALSEATRCGVSVIASAHGTGLEDLLARPSTREALTEGAFRRIVVLGETPGRVRDIITLPEGGRWMDAMDAGARHRHRMHAMRPRDVRRKTQARGDVGRADRGSSVAAPSNDGDV